LTSSAAKPSTNRAGRCGRDCLARDHLDVTREVSAFLRRPHGPERHAHRYGHRRCSRHQPEMLRIMLVVSVEHRMRQQQPKPQRGTAHRRRPGQGPQSRHYCAHGSRTRRPGDGNSRCRSPDALSNKQRQLTDAAGIPADSDSIRAIAPFSTDRPVGPPGMTPPIWSAGPRRNRHSVSLLSIRRST
jgi:hypothetical protein